MKTKTIFKTLALAMLMPAMMLTTACSNDDDALNNTANTENTINKGYALPVTVNVTRQGDATTRATYNETDKVLEFSDGDKLFVYGNHYPVGKFAGTLTWQSGGTFSGTIYTESPYEGTANDLFAAASAGSSPECYLTATLLPNGYDEGSNSFLSIDNKNTTEAYDDRLTVAFSDAFVASETAKATGVEQLSWERTTSYSSVTGFALSPGNAILNFTITGLEAGAKNVSLQIDNGMVYTVTGSVTPTSGVATFAIGVPVGANIKEGSNNLTVGSSNLTLPSSTTFAAGHIYNIARNAIPGALIGQFSVSDTKKVYFSKGNLRYASGTWSFFDNQYDYYTSYSAGAWDKFGWSTSANTYGMSTSATSSDYSGDFVDWGATMGTGWCTLSRDEWRYLFNNRSDAADKYGFATVNGVHGIIFLPDAFVDPNKNDGSNAFVGSTIDWDANLYTAENWALMEKNGAVFLPAAGYRDEADVDDVGDRGYYWSSSAKDDEEAYSYYVYFSSDDLIVDDNTSCYWGHSVRLVRPVQ